MSEARRLEAAYEAFVARLGSDEMTAVRERARAAFEKRAGAFAPEDGWFESRSRAFLDDAVTDSNVLAALAPSLPEPIRAWIAPLSSAHRGLFEIEEVTESTTTLRCLVSGAELRVTDLDDSTRIALDEAHGLFDARVVGRAEPYCIGVLPGVLFHAEEATEPIMKVLDAARKRGMGRRATLDALLRMEHKWRTLSRMKASYAYREEALAPDAPESGSLSATKTAPNLAERARAKRAERG